jgi:hypothetical protein
MFPWYLRKPVPFYWGHAPIVPESQIMEVPLEADPDAGFLPPEWR